MYVLCTQESQSDAKLFGRVGEIYKLLEESDDGYTIESYGQRRTCYKRRFVKLGFRDYVYGSLKNCAKNKFAEKFADSEPKN